jgi:hypothetical protein
VQGSDGNVGLGTASPDEKLHIVDGDLKVIETQGEASYIRTEHYSTVNWHPFFLFRRSPGGTPSVPSGTTNNLAMGRIQWEGYAPGDDWRIGAQISVEAAQNWQGSPVQRGTDWRLSVAPNDGALGAIGVMAFMGGVPEIVFNESGFDVDLRVETTGSTNSFFVQGSDGFVGIGTSAPARKLEILDDEDVFLRIAPGALSRAAQFEFVRDTTFTWFGPTATDEFHFWSQENVDFVMALNNTEIMRAMPTGIFFNDADGPVAFAHYADDGELVQFNDPTYNKIIIGDNRGYWSETVPSKLYGHLSVVLDNIAGYPNISLEKYNDTAYYPQIHARVAKGTFDSPANIGTHNLFSLQMQGYDGHVWRNAGGLNFRADPAWTSGSYPLEFSFSCRTPSKSTASIMQVDWNPNPDFTGSHVFFNKTGMAIDYVWFSTGSAGGVATNPALQTIGATGEVQIRTSGLTVGAPTGGDKGQGTVNVATDMYKNDTAYGNPDYVLEHYYRGGIVEFADNPGADQYEGLMDLRAVDKYMEENLRIPQLAEGPMGMFDRGDALLLHLEQVYLYLIEQDKRLRDLENRGGEKDFQ